MLKNSGPRILGVVVGLTLLSLVLTGCCCYCSSSARRYRPFRWPRLRIGQIQLAVAVQPLITLGEAPYWR